MVDLTEYVATFVQIGGMIIVFVIGFIRFRATTNVRFESILEEVRRQGKAITGQGKSITKYGEIVTEVRIELAEVRTELKGVNKRLARMENKE